MVDLKGTDLARQIDALAHGCHDLTWQGFAVRLIKQPWGELLIALWGGQVLHFRPADQRPVLWVSEQPKRPPGAIRGGVPLCWPWFADHPEEASLPAHGVARTTRWQVVDEQLHGAGGRWSMRPVAPLWPDLQLSVQISVQDGALDIAMTTTNTGQQAVALTQALHSYLAISARDRVAIDGLAGCRYVDKLQAQASFEQAGSCRVTEATDRIFAHAEDVLLVDHGWRRVVRIGKCGSASTVLWNPGAAALQMADIGARQADRFVCIEAARTQAFDDRLLPAGASVCLATHFSIEEYLHDS